LLEDAVLRDTAAFPAPTPQPPVHHYNYQIRVHCFTYSIFWWCAWSVNE